MIRNADSANELRLNIKLKSPRGEPSMAAAQELSMHQEPTAEDVEQLRKEELARLMTREMGKVLVEARGEYSVQGL